MNQESNEHLKIPNLFCKFVSMPKEKKIRQEKKKGLSNEELIEKYGDKTSMLPFSEMINILISKEHAHSPSKHKRM